MPRKAKDPKGQWRDAYAARLLWTYNRSTGASARDIRMASGLSQDDVAAAVNRITARSWTAQTVSDIENGRREIRPFEAFALGMVFEVPAKMFLLPHPSMDVATTDGAMTIEEAWAVVLGDEERDWAASIDEQQAVDDDDPMTMPLDKLRQLALGEEEGFVVAEETVEAIQS